MVRTPPLFARDERRYLPFGFLGGSRIVSKPEAGCDAVHVRIDSKGWNMKRVCKHYAGAFTPDPW